MEHRVTHYCSCMSERPAAALLGYDSDPRWRRLVAYEKWMIRIWISSFLVPVVAASVSVRGFEIALTAMLVVGVPVFAVCFWTGIHGMWRERRGQLPEPNSWIDWYNSSWSAAWQEAWRRPKGRSAAEE